MMVVLNRKKNAETPIDANVKDSVIFLIKALARIEDFEKDSNALSEMIEKNLLETWLQSSDCKAQLDDLKNRIEDAGYKRNTFYKHLQNVIKNAGAK